MKRICAAVVAAIATATAACGGGDGDGGGPTGPTPPPDTQPPTITITAPTAGTTTAGQSGFPIQLGFSDDASGVNAASLSVTSSRAVGGVFTRSGVSASFPAGTNLVPLFGSVSASAATLQVVDSAAFAAGQTTLTVRIADQAGNQATANVSFTVGADPERLVLADARGGAGTAGVTLEVGLRTTEPVAGVQLDLGFAGNIARVDSVRGIGRAAAFTGGGAAMIDAGTARIARFDPAGSAIGPGDGAVLRLFLTIRNDAAAGSYDVTPAGVRLSTPDGASRQPAQVLPAAVIVQ